MPGIFISYRREDSAGYAQRLFELISSHFGKSRVFIDIDSIEAGADFGEVIRDRLAQCDAFLALIGRNWVRCTDPQGHRRLDDPRDFVRIEVAQALGRGMRVIPVLVGGAQMPRPEELPADIRPLTLHNAHEIPDRFFKQSVQQLIRLLQTSVRSGGWPVPVPRRVLVAAAGGVSLLTAGVVLTSILFDKTEPKTALKTAGPGPAAGDMPQLAIPDTPARPPVVVREPEKASQLPLAVAGSWTIDKLDFTADTIGPRQQPRLRWAVRITIGDAWEPAGFAPDQTVYIWDREHSTLCGIRGGTEEWAYRDAFGFGLMGIAPDGRVWLTGRAGVYCYNSKGEGGSMAGLKAVPHNLLSKAVATEKTSVTCRGGGVQLPGRGEPIPVDGNCQWAVRGDPGKFYAATDRHTVYCLSSAGAVLWKYDAGTAISSEPVIALGDLIVGGEDRLLCLRDGLLRWGIPLKGCRPAMVDKAGTTYLSGSESGGKKVTAAVDRDGHVLWRFQPAYQCAGLDPEGRLYLIDRQSLLCVSG